MLSNTKDFLAKCLATKYKVVKTQANFNNEIGLPKTLFDITADTDIAVVEMGMRGMHQIESLCRLAKPESGLVTNVGDAHLELLGSHENIAKAKSELVVDLPRSGYAVLNGDNEYTRKMGEVTSADKVFFGFNPENDYYAENVTMNLTGTDFVCVEKYSGKKVNVHLPVLGAHNVYNALAAMTMALGYGGELEASAQALRDAVLSQRRLELVQKQGITFIDDSYNAAPDSVKSALNTLMATEGKRHVAMLGDMFELGFESENGHRSVGAYAAEKGVDMCLFIGEKARAMLDGWVQYNEEAGYRESIKKLVDMPLIYANEDTGTQAEHFPNKEMVIAHCMEHLMPGDVVLIKASNGMHLDKIVERIME